MGFDYTTIEGALSPEQAAAALAAGEGDTSAELENGGTPDATTVTDDAAATDGDNKAKPDAAATGEDAGTTTEAGDPANAVVLARDGKHTIPYETLVKHREGEQHWKAQAEAAQQQLADLQAQAQARADAGTAPTKTDNMVATAEAAIEAGADFVKTSTGFYTGGPSVGATPELVEAMIQRVNGRCKVKGSGGIRDREHFLKLIDMGIDRMGVGYKSTPVVLNCSVEEARKMK